MKFAPLAKFIVGVNSENHLTNIISTYQSLNNCNRLTDVNIPYEFSCLDESLINPINW